MSGSRCDLCRRPSGPAVRLGRAPMGGASGPDTNWTPSPSSRPVATTWTSEAEVRATRARGPALGLAYVAERGQGQQADGAETWPRWRPGPGRGACPSGARATLWRRKRSARRRRRPSKCPVPGRSGRKNKRPPRPVRAVPAAGPTGGANGMPSTRRSRPGGRRRRSGRLNVWPNADDSPDQM